MRTFITAIVLSLFCISNANAQGPVTPISATIPYDIFGTASGTYRVWLKTANGDISKLTKPVIIAEGIDFLENIDEAYIYSSMNKQLSNNLADNLRESGYDVIILNYGNSGDYIQKNAFLLVKLIQTINNIKNANGSNEGNVVCGISMGGLVSRYALTYMETHSLNHETRLFVSFDSPQAGADFPLGIQHWMPVLGAGIPLTVAENVFGINTFNSPAAEQMLFYHYQYTDGNPGHPHPHPLYSALQNELNSMNSSQGYPQLCKKIAISNGSRVGQEQQGYPGTVALAYTIDGFLTSGNISTISDWDTIKIYTHDDLTVGNKYCGIYPAKAYDNATGSYINWFKLIADQINNNVQSNGAIAPQPNACFIPTLSSLGFNDNGYGLKYNVENDYNLICGIPFDEFYAPKENQFHTSLPTITANWLYDQIIEPDLWNVKDPYTSFNFGNNTDYKICKNVLIENTGKLKINVNQNTDYYIKNISGGYYNPQPLPNTNNFEVYYPPCIGNKSIIVRNNGELIIGDPTSNYNGSLRIGSGNSLIIKNGGFLKINNNSKVIVEPGAKLIFEQGASIQLNGDNAVLEIQGTVEVGNNAMFTFTGSGYMKFNSDANPDIVAGTNSSFVLAGSGKTDKILEINKVLTANSTLKEFKLIGGKAEISYNSFLQLGCPYYFNNTKFTGATGGNGWIEIWQNGSNSLIGSCDFENVQIVAKNFINNSRFRMFSSTVKGTQLSTPVELLWVGGDFRNVTFEGAQSSGCLLNYPLSNSTFTNCNFTGMETFGIESATVPSNVEISIKGTTINANPLNEGAGIRMDNGTLSLKCSNISNNRFGRGVMLENGAQLNASTETTNGGYNTITNNGPVPFNSSIGDYTNINLYNSGPINLNLGYNDLSKFDINNPNVYSRVTNYYLINGTINSPCLPSLNILANKNRWFPLGYISPTFPGVNTNTSPLASMYNIQITPDPLNPCYNIFSVNDDNVPPKTLACGTNDPPNPPFSNDLPPDASAFMRFPCTVINTTDFDSVPYNDAIRIAMTKMSKADSTQDDVDAINLFYQILKTPINTNEPREVYLRNFALDQMNYTITDAFSGKSGTADSLSLSHTAVQQVLDVYDYLAAPATADNYRQQYDLAMNKAFLYRLTGRRDLAISEMNNISNCFLEEYDYKQIDNYRNYTDIENKIVTGVIPIEKIDSLMRPKPIEIHNPAVIGNNSNVNATASLGYNVTVGNNVTLQQNVRIGNNVKIGNNVTLKKDVVISDGCTIGNNTIIDKATVIGKDNSIGYNVNISKNVITGDNSTIKNNVTIEDSVKIGGLTTIGNNTSLKKKTQLADGSYIEQNVAVDKDVRIGNNVIIRSNTSLKKNVLLGDRSTIGQNVVINAGAKVGADVTIKNNTTLGSNAKVCDGLNIIANVSNNGSMGSCTLPTAPTNPFTPYDEVFAAYQAKINGTVLNSFKITNVDTSKKNYSVDRSMQFEASKYSATYYWDFGDCSYSALRNPVHTYTKPGIYIVKLTQSIHCVSSTKVGAVTIYPNTTPSFIAQSVPPCTANNIFSFNKKDSIVDLQPPACFNHVYGSYKSLDSAMLRIRFIWNFDSARTQLEEVYSVKNISENLDSIIHCTFSEPREYAVSLTSVLEYKNAMLNNWYSTDINTQYIETIVPGEKLTADFDFNNTVCRNDSIAFNNTSTGGKSPYTYLWRFGNGDSSISENPKVIFDTTGDFSVTLIMQDALGCSDTLTSMLTVSNCQTLNSIKGYLFENVQCGGDPRTGDTLLLIDPSKNIVGTVTPVVTDANGYFMFNYNKINALDTTMHYSIVSKNGYNLIDTSYHTIREWVELSPLHFSLMNFNQEWIANLLLGDSLYNMAAALDLNGNLYVTGGTENLASGVDYLTVKYGADGIQKWTAVYNGIANARDFAKDIIVDDAGNCIVTGISDGSHIYDYTTIMYSPQGVQKWVARFDAGQHDEPVGLCKGNNGNIVVTGSSNNSSYKMGIVTIMYDSLGNELWNQRFDKTYGNVFATGIKNDVNGNIFVNGKSVNDTTRYLLLKYDPIGQLLWTKEFYYSGSTTQECTGITTDANGNVIINGTCTVNGTDDVVTIKYNASGLQQWVKNVANASGSEVISDTIGNIITSGIAGSNYFVNKYDYAGTLLWTAPLDVSGWNSTIPAKISVGIDGGVCLAGTITQGMNKDYLTVMLNSDGSERWRKTYSLTSSSFETVADIEISRNNNVYVTGYSSYADQNLLYTMFATVKYSQCPGTASLLKHTGSFENTIQNTESIFFDLYPNPAKDEVNIKINKLLTADADVCIYNFQGGLIKCLHMNKGTSQLLISTTEFTGGIYLVQINTNGNLPENKKLIILK